MSDKNTSTLFKKDSVKYNIYNSNDELVATIHDRSEGSKTDMSLEIHTDDIKQLPFILQLRDISSEILLKFLKGRVLPNRVSVSEELHNRGLEYNWREMIKLNNGRTLTDNFYILIHDNEEETKKSTKTCIIESKEIVSEKMETPEVIDDISNKDKEQMESL